MHEGRECERLARVMGEERAQGTVEYALTMFALLAIVAACAAVWHAAQDGAFSALVEQAASHALSGAGIVDIALY